MQLAIAAAGFTPGEADQLRRAMGAWRRSGVIDRFRVKLMDGMKARGLSPQFAEQVFNQIRGFGEYGFPESHAASFALLAYVSAWLKHYYPAAFTAALLNSQPMGFYAPAQLVQDAQRHGVVVRPADVNASERDCTLEPLSPRPMAGGDSSLHDAPPIDGGLNEYALRLGLRMISGIKSTAVDAILAARSDGPFRSYADFVRRARLGRATLETLSDADAFGSLTIDRREALWLSLGQERVPRDLPLFAEIEDTEPLVALPELSPFEQVLADYQALGVSLKGHPMQFFRGQLERLRIVPACKLGSLNHNTRVSVAGIVTVRQRPSTAKGITFVSLEDETGTSNLVVRQATWEKYYAIARRSPAWIAHGILECKGSVINILITRLEDLSARLGPIPSQSRDFR